MLKIHFGKKTFPKEILQVDQVFDLNVNNDWLNTDFAKRVIKGIDNSEHVVDSYIKSPFWGTIPPQRLSTGCKKCSSYEVLSFVSNILWNKMWG